MNIQGIQFAQSLLRAAEGKAGSAKATASAESEVSRAATNLPQAIENKILPDNSSLPTQKGDTFELVYPPFFPLGNTQGIYTVMIEAKSDSTSDAAQPQKAEKKTESKTAETKAAKPPVADKQDAPKETKAPETSQASDPGIILDLKV